MRQTLLRFPSDVSRVTPLGQPRTKLGGRVCWELGLHFRTLGARDPDRSLRFPPTGRYSPVFLYRSLSTRVPACDSDPFREVHSSLFTCEREAVP